MNKRRVLIIFIILIALLSIFLIANNYLMRVKNDFATSILLKYHYIDKDINAIIIDEDDSTELKNMLKGIAYTDYPSCGFTLDISITFTDGKQNITLCPACDGCSKLRVNDSDKYIRITAEERKRLNIILEKYGMIFPCV